MARGLILFSTEGRVYLPGIAQAGPGAGGWKGVLFTAGYFASSESFWYIYRGIDVITVEQVSDSNYRDRTYCKGISRLPILPPAPFLCSVIHLQRYNRRLAVYRRLSLVIPRPKAECISLEQPPPRSGGET